MRKILGEHTAGRVYFTLFKCFFVEGSSLVGNYLKSLNAKSEQCSRSAQRTTESASRKILTLYSLIIHEPVNVMYKCRSKRTYRTDVPCYNCKCNSINLLKISIFVCKNAPQIISFFLFNELTSSKSNFLNLTAILCKLRVIIMKASFYSFDKFINVKIRSVSLL